MRKFSEAEEVLQSIRQQLSLKGPHAFRTLSRAFQNGDLQRNGEFNTDNILNVFQSCNLFISRAKLNALLRSISGNRCKETINKVTTALALTSTDSSNAALTIATIVVHYRDLLESILGTLSEREIELVDAVWQKITNNLTSSTIVVDQIMTNFNPYEHPEVRSGQKTVQQLMKDFESAFTPILINQGNTTRIDRSLFFTYFSEIAVSTPGNEAYFIAMCINCFNVEENRRREGLLAIKRLQSFLREKMAGIETGEKIEIEKLRTLFRLFSKDKILSSEPVYHINSEQMSSAFQRFGLVIDEPTLSLVFATFDSGRTGMVDYVALAHSVYAETPLDEYHRRVEDRNEAERQRREQTYTIREYIQTADMIVAGNIPTQ